MSPKLGTSWKEVELHEKPKRAGERTPRVKAIVTKLSSPSVIPGTHMVERENQLIQGVYCPLYIHTPHTHTHTPHVHVTMHVYF